MRNSSEFETFNDYSDMDSDPLTLWTAVKMLIFGALLIALVLALIGIAALVGPTPEVATWR